MIKVLLERKVPKKKFKELIGLLNDLRAEALHQPGYVCGETIIRGDNALTVLVISTWISEEHWKAWMQQRRCIEMDQIVDGFVGKSPKITVFRAPYPIV